MAMFAYAKGEEVELTEKAAIAFKSIREHIDLNNEKYKKSMEQKRKASHKRWNIKEDNDSDDMQNDAGGIRPNKSEMQNDSDGIRPNDSEIRNYPDKDKDKDNVKENVNVKEEEKEEEKENEKENVNEKEDKEEDNDINSLSSSSSSSSTHIEDYSRVYFSDEEKEYLFTLTDRSKIERYIDKIAQWQQQNKRLMHDPLGNITRWIAEDRAKPSYYDSRGYQGYSGGHKERPGSISAKEVEEFARSIDFDKLSTSYEY